MTLCMHNTIRSPVSEKDPGCLGASPHVYACVLNLSGKKSVLLKLPSQILGMDMNLDWQIGMDMVDIGLSGQQ